MDRQYSGELETSRYLCQVYRPTFLATLRNTKCTTVTSALLAHITSGNRSLRTCKGSHGTPRKARGKKERKFLSVDRSKSRSWVLAGNAIGNRIFRKKIFGGNKHVRNRDLKRNRNRNDVSSYLDKGTYDKEPMTSHFKKHLILIQEKL